MAVVTIPVSDYADLLDCRRQLAELRARERTFNKVSRSRIERDPEVATFLANRFGLAVVRAIRAECRERFGKARTPSMSAIYAYWSRLRLYEWRCSRVIPADPY